jgi:Uma2 family endonuclease
MPTRTKAYISEERYIELEERAEQRSEYFRGEMYPMETATISHGRIRSNMVFALRRELAESECEVFTGDLRISVSATGLYTYPDIVVTCGEPQVSEKDRNSVTNPKLIIEILSPTTADYDRGGKFAHYRSLPSFTEYLLIAQDRIYAEHHTKQPDGDWLLRETTNDAKFISLESIGVGFKLAEAYTRVKLKEALAE